MYMYDYVYMIYEELFIQYTVCPYPSINTNFPSSGSTVRSEQLLILANKRLKGKL